MEGGTRIETDKLFSRKYEFIKIAKSFPPWEQVNLKWRQLLRGDAHSHVFPLM